MSEGRKKRKAIKWNIVFLGFGILTAGILLIILLSNNSGGLDIINPLGVIFVLASIFVIGWGFRIKLPADG